MSETSHNTGRFWRIWRWPLHWQILLGLLFVFDRPLDMCRTAVNVFSDSVGAVTVAASEGELGGGELLVSKFR